MAEQKTGAAKHSADYRNRRKAEAERLGIEKLTIDMPAGVKNALKAELKRLGYTEVQELWQDLALSWIAADPDERARRLVKPDTSAFHITLRLARKFEQESRAELRRDPGSEPFKPPRHSHAEQDS